MLSTLMQCRDDTFARTIGVDADFVEWRRTAGTDEVAATMRALQTAMAAVDDGTGCA